MNICLDITSRSVLAKEPVHASIEGQPDAVITELLYLRRVVTKLVLEREPEVGRVQGPHVGQV